MNKPKPKVGKNYFGWYAALPQWTGSIFVIEGHVSWEEAMKTVASHHRWVSTQ